jgi:uncharacterized membrane protein YhaH (DUF805 family)
MPPLKNLLFSSNGRISRSRFLVGVFLSTVIPVSVLFITLMSLPFLKGNSSMVITTTLLLIPVITASLYASFCLYIKRLHDFNKTGWLSLLTLIPIPYLGILVIIVFGSIKGTKGTNQYGPDPLVVDKTI